MTQTPESILAVERAVLGRFIAYTETRAQLSDLRPDMFVEPVHAAVFAAAHALWGETGNLSQAAVLHRIGADSRLSELGGGDYLYALAERAGPLSETEADANALRTAALGRDLSETLNKVAAQAQQDPYAALTEAEKVIQGLRAQGTASDIETMRDAAADYLGPNAFDLSGIKTGLSCIDERLGGLMAGNLVVLAGRPSMGKTALLNNVLNGAAILNPKLKFVMFSLEMSRQELIARAISAISWDDGEMVTYGRLAKMPVAARRRWFGLVERLPTNLLIDDNRRVTVETVRRRIWALKAKGHAVGAVGIDYLQLMGKPEARGRNEASVIGEMTAELKRIAAETETCIVLLSQLSRQVETRDNKRPQLSDLRDSGAIEQDANSVLFCYRDSYYRQRAAGSESNGGDDDRVMEVVCAKNRGGPVGVDEMQYFAEFDVIKNGGGE